jgi:Holliday junction resolvase
MTNYPSGRAFEFEVRDRLRENGFQAFRTADPRMAADLIAIQPGRILYCRARRDGRTTPTERRALFRAAADVGALPVVARRYTRRPIQYRMLTDVGPLDWQPWTPDRTASEATA